MKNLVLILALVSGATVFSFAVCAAKGGNVFRYDPYYHLAERPFPVEMLVEVKSVTTVEPRVVLKSASIIDKAFTRQIECVEAGSSKSVKIDFSEKDYETVGSPKKGETLAVFGLDPSKKILFRLIKYTGASNGAAKEAWFRSIQ